MLVKFEKVFSWCNKQFRVVNKSNSSREYTYLLTLWWWCQIYIYPGFTLNVLGMSRFQTVKVELSNERSRDLLVLLPDLAPHKNAKCIIFRDFYYLINSYFRNEIFRQILNEWIKSICLATRKLTTVLLPPLPPCQSNQANDIIYATENFIVILTHTHTHTFIVHLLSVESLQNIMHDGRSFYHKQ